MPAWEFRLREGELWDLVAFLKALAALSPSAYRALKGSRLASAEAPRHGSLSRGAAIAVRNRLCENRRA
jgi:hypothetical protein